MNTWDTNTEWFVVRCNDRKHIANYIDFKGDLISWSEGINHFIDSENLVLSNPINEFIVIGGSNVQDLAFRNLESYMSFDNYKDRLREVINFLNRLSERFGEAYFFQTHDHHMINIGLFKSIEGKLIYGKAEVDCDTYSFVENESVELKLENIFDVIEKWTFNPRTIEKHHDISGLNWVEKQHTSLNIQMLRKLLGK